jgi:hypothetical protein
VMRAIFLDVVPWCRLILKQERYLGKKIDRAYR